MPQRLLKRDWWTSHWFVVGAAYVGIAVTFLLFLSVHNKTVTIDRICHGQNDIRNTLRTLVAASDKQLGKPGSAGYDYYRTHKQELAAAHQTNQQTIALFKPLNCSQ